MKLSIIGGAGTLGSAIAYQMGNINEIVDVCIIDINKNLAENHIMDLGGAYPHKRYYFGNYQDLTNSSIIIIAAGIPNRNDIDSRDAFFKGNVKLLKEFGENIKKYAEDSLIMIASNPVDALNYYLYETFKFKKRQLLGYSLNDSLRFEKAIRKSLELPADTKVTSPVIGEHGDYQVPLFSQIQINQQKKIISEQKKEDINKEIKDWFIDFNNLEIDRTTGWMTAKGIGILVEKIVNGNKFITVGSAIMDGEY